MEIKTYDSDNDSTNLEYDSDLQYFLSSDSEEELPDELDYTIRPKRLDQIIDVEMLHYNDSFKRRGIRHVLNNMPNGTGFHIPGWQQVLEAIAENISDSPLEELMNRKIYDCNNIDERKDMSLSEQQDGE